MLNRLISAFAFTVAFAWTRIYCKVRGHQQPMREIKLIESVKHILRCNNLLECPRCGKVIRDGIWL